MGADGRCLPCLLRGGLGEETVVDSAPAAGPDATMYGDFEITRRDDGTLWELGRGAMGVTYRAVDRTLHRPVALKVIQFGTTPADGSDLSVALRERFLREARAAAALRHANVAGFSTSEPPTRPDNATTPWNWSRARRSKPVCAVMVRSTPPLRSKSPRRSRRHSWRQRTVD